MSSFIKEYWHHFKWHILVLPAMGVVGWVWSKLHVIARPDNHNTWVAYLYEHPYRALVLCLFVCYITYQAYSVVLKVTHALMREKQYGAMIEGIGLHEFSHHADEVSKKNDWDKCVKEIEKSKSNFLHILGATGWETFGSPQSPLHKLLIKFDGQIRILLIKEGGEGFKHRTSVLHHNEEDYKREIIDTIAFCKKLKVDYGKEIEVRQYVEAPIWKMIQTDRYLWLQYYDPSNDVENTPVYTLQTRDTPMLSSLYYPLTRVFEKRWAEKTTRLVSLETPPQTKVSPKKNAVQKTATE
ncbi:MAG: hypothetical protein PHU06_13335 [Gallionella sp.]|nr:hypothetical protein [Gallionella sp.]MDD4959799.1 hypothetical protein [Gallionella sp.]